MSPILIVLHRDPPGDADDAANAAAFLAATTLACTRALLPPPPPLLLLLLPPALLAPATQLSVGIAESEVEGEAVIDGCVLIISCEVALFIQ